MTTLIFAISIFFSSCCFASQSSEFHNANSELSAVHIRDYSNISCYNNDLDTSNSSSCEGFLTINDNRKYEDIIKAIALKRLLKQQRAQLDYFLFSVDVLKQVDLAKIKTLISAVMEKQTFVYNYLKDSLGL